MSPHFFTITRDLSTTRHFNTVPILIYVLFYHNILQITTTTICPQRTTSYTSSLNFCDITPHYFLSHDVARHQSNIFVYNFALFPFIISLNFLSSKKVHFSNDVVLHLFNSFSSCSFTSHFAAPFKSLKAQKK